METLKENKGLVAVAVLLALLVGISAYNSSAGSSSNDDEAKQSQQAEKSDDDKSKDETEDKDNKDDDSQKTSENDDQSSDSYQYVAQPGDSYSVLARKAVQTYGIINNVRLSPAEILAAETKLTQDAGEQYLNEGQTVSLNIADVKAAMDYAQDLSDDEKAAWATYVPYVDFDTRNRGE